MNLESQMKSEYIYRKHELVSKNCININKSINSGLKLSNKEYSSVSGINISG